MRWTVWTARQFSYPARPCVFAAAALVAAAIAIVPPREVPALPGPTGWLPPYIHLTVASVPPGARVYLVGRALPLGRTPLSVALPSSPAPLTLLLVEPDGTLITRDVVPTHDIAMEVPIGGP